MSDETPGYEAEPYEVDLVAGSEIEEITAAWPDLLPRYAALTARQAFYQAVSDRLAASRAEVIAQMHADGMSYGKIAVLTAMSRGRVQQLVEKSTSAGTGGAPNAPS
jgi:DNA-directed RNA polymerase specialized sigma24 family protein